MIRTANARGGQALKEGEKRSIRFLSYSKLAASFFDFMIMFNSLVHQMDFRDSSCWSPFRRSESPAACSLIKSGLTPILKTLLSSLVVFAITSILHSACGATELGIEAWSAAASRLASRELQQRTASTRELINLRLGIKKDLLHNLDKLAQDPDRTFESPLHLIIEVLGEWRVDEAVIPLVKIIDYEIDRKTMPVGDKLPRSAFFPAAQALAKIGGPTLISAVSARLGSEDNERANRICLWVMFTAYGHQGSKGILSELAVNSDSEVVRTRMEKAIKLLPLGDSLLVF